MPLKDPKSGKREPEERDKKKPQNRTKLGLLVKVVKAKNRNC